MTLAFGLFFLGPLLGILFITVNTGLFGTDELLYCLIGLMVSALFGYLIMRQISNGILRLEHRMAEKLDGLQRQTNNGDNELRNITSIADAMSDTIEEAKKSLGRRTSEIHALKELNGLSSFQVSGRSLAHIALKRSMEVTDSPGGAVILVTGKKAVCFHVLGEGITLQKDQTIAYEEFLWRRILQQERTGCIGRDEVSNCAKIVEDGCRGVAFSPLGCFSSTTAVVVLAVNETELMDETTLGFLATYFSAVGNILKMLEIERKKRETADELNTVLSIIKIISRNPKEADLVGKIAKQIEQILPYHWIGLALLTRNPEELYLSHSFTRNSSSIKTGTLIIERRSLFHLAMNAEEPLILDNLDLKKEYFEKSLFQEQGVQSCILASLKSSGRPIGVICLGSNKKNGFGRREKRLFGLTAKSVSIALDQSRAVSRERAKRTELEILQKIGSALSTHTIKANKVLPYVLERIVDLVKVEAGSIMLMQFDSLVVETAIGKFKTILEKQKFSLNHGVAGYVVATGESVIVDDVRKNPHFLSAVDEKTGFETKNLLCVPMISGARVIGVIELLNRIDKPFSDEDLQVVKAVAASTSVALETTRIYGESAHIAKKEKLIRTIFQKYVPEEVVGDILQRGEPSRMAVGQKRIVTVFNVDIRGYTRMSKQASTEDVVHILNHFFKRMGQIVINHHGLLDKYLGDGMLAIFGAPVQSANPALDAVLAAMDMIKEIEQISILALDRCATPIKIGISINTGEAIVGNIGFSKKMEYTVIGDVVNEAFRIQDLTRVKENSIFIGEATYKQVRSSILTRPLGLKKLDDSLVNVYEVITDSSLVRYEGSADAGKSSADLSIH